MEVLDYRPAVATDAQACVELRGKTRENAISAQGLAELGITVTTWGSSIETGRLSGRVCTVRG